MGTRRRTLYYNMKSFSSQARPHILVVSAASLSPSNSRITSTCSTTLTRSLTLATSVAAHSRNSRHFRTTKGYTVERDHLPAKHVERASDKGFPTLFTGTLFYRIVFSTLGSPLYTVSSAVYCKTTKKCRFSVHNFTP